MYPKKENVHFASILSDVTQLVEVQLFVPNRFNNGKIIPVKEFTEFENKLTESAGAFTKYPCIGIWKDGSRVYVDNNKEYKIITSVNRITELKNIAEEVRKAFHQESVLLSTSPIKVSFT